jgi:hypothetical protein
MSLNHVLEFFFSFNSVSVVKKIHRQNSHSNFHTLSSFKDDTLWNLTCFSYFSTQHSPEATLSEAITPNNIENIEIHNEASVDEQT